MPLPKITDLRCPRKILLPDLTSQADIAEFRSLPSPLMQTEFSSAEDGAPLPLG